MTKTASFPKKLFYKIQEVANIVGVEPYVLRYWETKFPMLSPEKDGSDQRRYRQKDIELLLRIRDLLYGEKYTIAGAVEKLKDEGPGRRKRPASAAAREEDDAAQNSSALHAPDQTEAGWTPPDDTRADRIRKVREDLGLLRRELEQWRDELS